MIMLFSIKEIFSLETNDISKLSGVMTSCNVPPVSQYAYVLTGVKYHHIDYHIPHLRPINDNKEVILQTHLLTQTYYNIPSVVQNDFFIKAGLCFDTSNLGFLLQLIAPLSPTLYGADIL